MRILNRSDLGELYEPITEKFRAVRAAIKDVVRRMQVPGQDPSAIDDLLRRIDEERAAAEAELREAAGAGDGELILLLADSASLPFRTGILGTDGERLMVEADAYDLIASRLWDCAALLRSPPSTLALRAYKERFWSVYLDAFFLAGAVLPRDAEGLVGIPVDIRTSPAEAVA